MPRPVSLSVRQTEEGVPALRGNEGQQKKEINSPSV